MKHTVFFIVATVASLTASVNSWAQEWDQEVPPPVILDPPPQTQLIAQDSLPLPRRAVRYSLGGGATILNRRGNSSGIPVSNDRAGGEIRGTVHSSGTRRQGIGLRMDATLNLRMIDGPGGMNYLVSGDMSGEVIIGNFTEETRVHLMVTGETRDLGDLIAFQAGGMLCFSNNQHSDEWHFMFCAATAWLRAEGYGLMSQGHVTGLGARFEYTDVVDIIARVMGTMPGASESLWTALARLRLHTGPIPMIGAHDMSVYVEVSWLRAVLGSPDRRAYNALESGVAGSTGLAIEF